MKIKNGKVVNVHYVGTLSDGTEFDNSRTKGTRLKFEIGSGRMLPGFENAVISMNVGETKKFSLTSEQAYGSPKPESPPFVAVGDNLKKGQVICIIEAMKLFNEIESEVDGVIEKVCIENGAAVEFGQVLFLIKPL